MADRWTQETALDFLRHHQPLPPDRELSEETIGMYDRVLTYFISNPDAAAVPLFLNSFGEGSGFGVYQLVEDFIRKFPPELVVPHLLQGMASQRGSVRYWCIEIASWFEDDRLHEPLLECLRDANVDIRCAALTALQGQDIPNLRLRLQDFYSKETDADVIEMYEDLLQG